MTITPFAVQREESGPFAGIGTLWLEQEGKPVVVLDGPLIQRLEATLANMPKDLLGLVLASRAERAFVAGADLKSIMEMDDEQLDRYLRYGSTVFGMLAALPYPTAAAIHGATLGGGLELAMHCDALIGAPPASKDGQPGKPYAVGLPEAGLGICPGWGGTNLLPARIDPETAIRLTAAGKPMMFEEAKAAGLFDAVAPDAGSLLDTAKKWVAERLKALNGGRLERDGAPGRWIGRMNVAKGVLVGLDKAVDDLGKTDPGRSVAEAVDAGLAKGWDAALATERRHLIRLRNTPAARESIANFFAKSAKPKA